MKLEKNPHPSIHWKRQILGEADPQELGTALERNIVQIETPQLLNT